MSANKLPGSSNDSRRGSVAALSTTSGETSRRTSLGGSGDETLPLLQQRKPNTHGAIEINIATANGSKNSKQSQSNNSQKFANQRARRQSASAIVTGSLPAITTPTTTTTTHSLPGRSQLGCVERESRAASLISLDVPRKGSRASSIGGLSSQMSQTSEMQLYEALFKAVNKRRQSMQQMNSATASLLMSAAPGLVSGSPASQRRQFAQSSDQLQTNKKKSVCFADFVGTNDYDYDYDDEDELVEEDEEELDEEEQRRRTLERMKRKKEEATFVRIRRYGYDPLNPPLPKSWAEWSMQRRDYQSALGEVLQIQKAPQLSTAALKGRKESVAFVKEDLQDLHLNKKQNDGLFSKKIDQGDKEKKAESKKAKSKAKKGKGAVHHRSHHAQLSDADMDTLRAYYHHGIFTLARAVGVLLNLMATTMVLIAIFLPFWIKIPDKFDPYEPEYLYQLSMLQNCTISLNITKHTLLTDLKDFASDIKEVVDHGSLQQLQHAVAETEQPKMITAIDGNSTRLISTQAPSLEDDDTEPPSNHTFIDGECVKYSFGAWQSFIIGVFVFALLFAVFAFVLSACGTCTGSLPKRLYYHHSASEMLYVSAILTLGATIGFPVCVRYQHEIPIFTYSYGFFVSAVGALTYFISATLFNLDHYIMCTVQAKEHREIKRRRPL